MIKSPNVNLTWLLFLWLLEDIAQSEVSLKKKPQCGFDVAFVSMVTGGYSPIRGLIQEKATMWIRCGFCFYGYWALGILSEDFLKEKPQCGLNVAFGFHGYCNVYTSQPLLTRSHIICKMWLDFLI